jgi:ArsR family transcriptional regulator, arsenate/arsenite/antimonite-responsive transcriptional repressor
MTMDEKTCNDQVRDVLEQLRSSFQALGDPVRQQIISLLIDKESLNVTQIAEHIPMSRPTVSHHLKILRQAKLLDVQKKGTEMYYRLAFVETIDMLKKLVSLVEGE